MARIQVVRIRVAGIVVPGLEGEAVGVHELALHVYLVVELEGTEMGGRGATQALVKSVRAVQRSTIEKWAKGTLKQNREYNKQVNYLKFKKWANGTLKQKID